MFRLFLGATVSRFPERGAIIEKEGERYPERRVPRLTTSRVFYIFL
jgi:hypothetical protein